MSDPNLDELERLWHTYQARLQEHPDLSTAEFAVDYPESAEDILKLFPMMKDLSEFAKSPISLPERIGDYHIVRQVGIGGMGVVYEATSQTLRERVAIKVVDPLSLAGTAASRLGREAHLVATLHHSNIVPVYETGEFEGNHFFTMRFIDGPNLAEVLHYEDDVDDADLATSECRALQIAETIAENWDAQIGLIRQAASAISYAHDKGILHRDVKPANFLIDESLKLWVTDFGLAKLRADDQQRKTVQSRVMGTPRYMAPEQIRGEADERSDIFGLGITFYEMSLLRKDARNARKPIWRGGLRSPRELNASVPVAIDRIIMKAVALDPSDRHASVDDFIKELDSIASGAACSETESRGWQVSVPEVVTLVAGVAATKPSVNLPPKTERIGGVVDATIPESGTSITLDKNLRSSWDNDAQTENDRSNGYPESNASGETDDDTKRNRGPVTLGALGLTGLLVFLSILAMVRQSVRGTMEAENLSTARGESTKTSLAFDATSFRNDPIETTIKPPSRPSGTGYRIADGATAVGEILGFGNDGLPVRIAGPDARLFEFNVQNRTLSFRHAVDFESPRDEDLNNVYEIRLVQEGGSSQDTSTCFPISICVADVNESPSFASHMFVSDNSIVISEQNVAFPTALEILDDENSQYDGMHVAITGGDDRELFGMTPSGVFAFVRPVSTRKPQDQDRDGIYEIQVSASDSTQAYFARLERRSSGEVALVRDRLVRNASIDSERVVARCRIRPDVIDIATADGETFFHIHPEGNDTLSLFKSVRVRDQLASVLLCDDCALPSSTVALATIDGRRFAYLTAKRGATQLHYATLGPDNAFLDHSSVGSVNIIPQVWGLSWLDQNRFQHIRPTAQGAGKFYFSFSIRQHLINMPLHDEPQFVNEVLGQASWVEKGSDSITTIRSIDVKVVPGND